jgi:hypothetical protein
MKRMIIAVLAAAFALAACPAASRAGEEYMADPAAEPADFRGVRWQAPLSDLGDMEEQYREEDGSQITCRRKDEDLTFGGAKLDSIEYIFVNGRLSMVAVVAKERANEDALLREAMDLFGQETTRAGEDYLWRFTDVSVMFSREQDEQSVLFYQYIGFMRNRR